jgi:hypothetical protein
MCTNILNTFKFVKILFHFQVQVLSSKKKPQLFVGGGGISEPTEDAESCIFFYLKDLGQENDLKS